MADIRWVWLMRTMNCHSWGRGSSEMTSDTTYITSASGTNLEGGREGGREGKETREENH